MLLLTSGRVVDLFTERAKYHALNNHGPLPDAEHRALYSLVDIVYRRWDEAGQVKRGWTEYDFDFSNYTLANIHLADDWSDAEKAELYLWITQDSQKQRIETTRRRLSLNQAKLSTKFYSAPTQLYSYLYKRIENLSLAQASVKQWRGTLQNMQQKGIRQEELHWSGVLTALAKKQETQILSKQELLSLVNFKHIYPSLSTEQIWGTDGGLSFTEVASKMPHQAVYRAALKLDDSCHCILRYVDDTCNYRVGVVKTLDNEHDMALNKCWFALDPYGRAIPNQNAEQLFFSHSHAAIKAADCHAREEFGLHNGAKYNTFFDHLTLYGGSDYREWIVSLSDYQRVFFGAHHLDHNVLLHLRTTNRVDHFGRKLLFIEEVQSDWHQNGLMHGYNNSSWGRVADAPFKKEWSLLAMKLMLIQACQDGYDGIAWPFGDIQESRYTKSLKMIKQRYDVEIPKALNQLGKRLKNQVEITHIETRDPWLNVVKSKDKWSVADCHGKFKTRDKYQSREEALLVLNRHCKNIQLPVYAFFLSEPLQKQINCEGLPLFGQQL